MIWRELPPLSTDIAVQFPNLGPIALVAGYVDDHVPELFADERPAIASAQPRRAREFATGRWLARGAMAELGMEPAPIRRAPDRSPVWPDSVIGSITHSGDVAVAAVARSGNLRGLGIDLEQTERLGERLYRRIFTPNEIEGLRGANPSLAAVMFSAKEAGYKAISPHVRRYVGFQEAEVEVDWAAQTVRFRYVGSDPASRIMEEGVGYFGFFERYVLTVFIIP